MSRNMSTLGTLSIQQEDYLYDELKDKLSVHSDKEISIWPEDFLKSNNIIEKLTETELKVLNIDYGKLLKNLAHHNPDTLFIGKIGDTRQDFGPGPKQIVETLRMRKKIPREHEKADQHLISLKKKNLSTKVKKREEFEVPLTQHEKFNEMFREVGLLPLKLKEKVRNSFKIHDVTKLGDKFEVEDIILDIDSYYDNIDIPTLAEIEGNDYEVIMKWIRILGLERQESLIVNRSSRQMLKYYKQRPDQQTSSTKDELSKILLNGNGNGKKKIK